MSDTSLHLPSTTAVKRRPFSTFQGFAKYTIIKSSLLLVTVTIAVYLTIIIANFGGFVDEVISNNIAFSVAMRAQGGWLRGVPEEEKFAIMDQTIWAMEEAAGLHEPFLIRTFRWLYKGMTLDWGEGAGGTAEIRRTVVDHLSRTLLVFGAANILLFFSTIFLALSLTRRYGSWFDRFFAVLSPMSSAPAWVYGVIVNAILLKLFVFSTGGTLGEWPDEFQLSYLPILLRHLLPPFLAIFLSGLFQGVYAWRTFFLVYSSEDSVDMAIAKGLKPKTVERQYILRPALPGIITSFALMSMMLWQEVIALEYFFNVEGIGRLFLTSLRRFNTPMIVAQVVTFAYLLAVTVFLLDIIYALVDPRVRVGNNGQGGTIAVKNTRQGFRSFFRKRPKEPIPQKISLPLPANPQRSKNLRSLSWYSPLVFVWKSLKGIGRTLRQVINYPSAAIGLLIITFLIGVAIYTVIAIPYHEAISLWRGEDNVWIRNPKNASPEWVNYFRREKLPPTLIMDSRGDSEIKSVSVLTDEITEVILSFPFEFSYDAFPQEMTVYYDAEYEEKTPHITLTWLTPDGREIQVGSFVNDSTYLFSQDDRLQRELDTDFPQRTLFTDPAKDELTPMKGLYELQISGLLFEDDADLDAEFIVYGQVHGLAGTDQNRRDLMVALLWGTPVALAFGLIAAVSTSVIGMLLAAVGTWFGGWADRLVQFFTEVNLILPFFPVSLMIFTMYSKSILVILGVTVALSIFGSAIKTYRAVFLQVKESPYIEAARAYGASDRRIVIHYLIPRIMAVMIPKLVILIPSYVFLEATLAFLGVSDPVLPTWGKLVVGSLSYGIQSGNAHLVLAPLSLLLLAGFAFAMVGLALEKVFEPRLRER